MRTCDGAATVTIQASIETVYSYLADFTRHPEWVKNQRFTWQPQTHTAERMVRAAGVDGLQAAVALSLAELKRRVEGVTG